MNDLYKDHKMKAEIKNIYPVHDDGWNCYPDDPFDFYVPIEIMIGLDGEEGADIFKLDVCSFRRLERLTDQKGILMRHILLLKEYDKTIIINTVNEMVDNISGENWEEIATILARYMFWEFEDYDRYHPSPWNPFRSSAN